MIPALVAVDVARKQVLAAKSYSQDQLGRNKDLHVEEATSAPSDSYLSPLVCKAGTGWSWLTAPLESAWVCYKP